MKEGIPAFSFVAQKIKSQIQNGDLKSGDRLPTEKMLSKTYNVSRTTVRRALSVLTQEGYLVLKPNVGHFVQTPKSQFESEQDVSVQTYLESLGINTYCKIESMSLVAAGEQLAMEFECEPDEPIICLHKLRYVDESVINDQFYYLKQKKFPDFNPWETERRSLDDIIKEDYGLDIKEQTLQIDAVHPTKSQANIANISSTKPVLEVKRISKLASGEIVCICTIYNLNPVRRFSFALKK